MSRKSRNKTEFFQKDEIGKEIEAITKDPQGRVVSTTILECFPPRFRPPSSDIVYNITKSVSGAMEKIVELNGRIAFEKREET